MDELQLLCAIGEAMRRLADAGPGTSSLDALSEPLAGIGASAALDTEGVIVLHWSDGQVDPARAAFEAVLNQVVELSQQAGARDGDTTLDPAAFLSELQRCSAAARWRDRRLSLCVFDVEGLTLGPGVDESRLVELVGAAARRSVRHGDVVGHLGAGRFALLFPRAGTFEARAAHRRVRDAVQRLELDGDVLFCGAAGYAELSEDGSGDLLADAVTRLQASRVRSAYTGPAGPGAPSSPLAG